MIRGEGFVMLRPDLPTAMQVIVGRCACWKARHKHYPETFNGQTLRPVGGRNVR